jgi:Calcium-dependent channel, 7TM region, putative phosphate
MAFISSLSSVSALRKQFPSLNSLLDAMPWLEPILQVLAPQFVIILNALLPTILEFITDFEGPISSALVTASLFVKLAAFMIIQTFFISALSGGVFQELHNIIEDPASIIDLLATSLPAQATYFCQITFVGTVTSAAMELLRIIPLILALLRQCIGPRLTEKERQTAFMGLRPLCDPEEFSHADFTSQAVRLLYSLNIKHRLNKTPCALIFFVTGIVLYGHVGICRH